MLSNISDTVSKNDKGNVLFVQTINIIVVGDNNIENYFSGQVENG